ncbi:RNA polymerase sigma factor [Haliscomenobacter hydrossis]|uniref:RNA polymerase, sigma-24 subunit, ECF subfamily n=1 Tax=Haliscomenobacter hydrossis (strain ATCC 27775 / DSM 1100 / LMG 10767 / O) TaxID=760192 RepID=F4KYA1_HALH1|nr:sigma-70 family RNA polymerase sigma factor [Haliscomenobacter hydrossis]AEE48364.1 RNA polymerase, sigma-24 subunit, ECF subfamily [Haliscomenobacter hydrossis DSM 1100]
MEQKTTFPEHQLVEMVKNSDRAVIPMLYQRYSSSLYGLIVKTIGNQEDAAEILQDVFLKIWQRGHQYQEDKGSLLGWMMRIAKNAALDHTRSRVVSQRSKTDQMDYLVSDGKGPKSEARIPDVGLRNVLDRMDERHRQMIDLLYYQNYTQSEVEELLGIPLGTVKTRARAAITHLRKILRNENV